MTKYVWATIFTASLLTLASGCGTIGDRSTGEVVDDTTLSTRVKTALLTDAVTDGLDIDVEVYQGRVQLNGFADSDEARERAEEIASAVTGVASVQNNLKITEGSRQVGEYIDDKVLVGRVNGALTKDPGVQAMNIDVEVNRGIVSLGGFVDSEDERTAAAEAAKRVPGVSKIVNNLQVR